MNEQCRWGVFLKSYDGKASGASAWKLVMQMAGWAAL